METEISYQYVWPHLSPSKYFGPVPHTARRLTRIFLNRDLMADERAGPDIVSKRDFGNLCGKKK